MSMKNNLGVISQVLFGVGLLVIILVPSFDLLFPILALLWIGPFVVLISGGLAIFSYFYYRDDISRKKSATTALFLNLVLLIVLGLGLWLLTSSFDLLFFI